MFDPNETIEHELDPAALHCLRTTRSGVLNVLIAVGLTVALTGAILRNREGNGPGRTGGWLLGGLLFVLAASTVLRRALGRRARLREPASRGPRFYWGHVAPAAIGALAAPLGLAHGLLVSPSLEAILPFWLTALVLGVLAYPRGRELQGFDLPMSPPGAPGR
jgi:drug/metabolite transporter (DMT)-like permease